MNEQNANKEKPEKVLILFFPQSPYIFISFCRHHPIFCPVAFLEYVGFVVVFFILFFIYMVTISYFKFVHF